MPDKPRPSNGRDKRDQVTDAAVELFLTNGYEQTSMDAIATRAKVSKTTVYAHYADKLALFKEVVERSARLMALDLDESRLQADDTTEAKLCHLVLAVLEATTRPEFLAFLRVMISEGTRHPDLAEVMRAAEPLDLLGLLTSLLQQDATERGYEIENPRQTATLLLRMASASTQLDSLVFPDFKPTGPLLEAHARWVTAVFLRGVRPRSDSPENIHPPTTGYDYPWFPDAVAQPTSSR